MDKKIEISEAYLHECLKHAANKLVGESLSHFDTLKNINDIKASVKNTIHQNFRDLTAQIEAFNYGIKFVTSPKTTDN